MCFSALALTGGGPVEQPEPARAALPVVEVALPTATAEVVEPEPHYPFLDGEDDRRSVSVGNTSHGFLVRGRPVEESDALSILALQKARDLRYGTEHLVGAIEFAAAQVHAETGRKLWLGNVGRRHGGDIPWSVSHNSGRDADIAFAYLNHKREPVDPPTLVPLNGQGVSREHGLFFDAHGTWLIVKGLITYPAAQVQYLFIEDGLRDQVLVAAKKAGAPATLIQRAAMLMRQPAGSSPHSDHLHLRVYCSERDVVGGCQNTGAAHPWASLYEGSKERAISRVVAVLGRDDGAQRQRAIERLVLLEADATEPIAARLEDQVPEVRTAAARALGQLGGRADVRRLVSRFAEETELPTRVALVAAVGELGGEAAGTFLAEALGVPRRDPRRALPAMDLAAGLHSPALLTLLPEAVALSRDVLTAGEPGIEGWLIGGSAASAREATVLQLATIAAA
ncbi:MAG: penicillin-insensitive murein endopeptidase, partial [Polyangiaceae bacterium]